MIVTILNGNPTDGAPRLDAYIAALGTALDSAGCTTDILTLRDLNAGYCTGCWACWVKTPGRCIFKDDSHLVCQSVIRSDFVVFASPIIMGYVSAVLKKFMDKMIPLVHPYITVDQAEAHHRHRYAPGDYPLGGLLLEKTAGSDDEDIEIIHAIHARTMLNLKTENAFTLLTEQPIEEVVNAILCD